MVFRSISQAVIRGMSGSPAKSGVRAGSKRGRPSPKDVMEVVIGACIPCGLGILWGSPLTAFKDAIFPSSHANATRPRPRNGTEPQIFSNHIANGYPLPFHLSALYLRGSARSRLSRNLLQLTGGDARGPKPDPWVRQVTERIEPIRPTSTCAPSLPLEPSALDFRQALDVKNS